MYTFDENIVSDIHKDAYGLRPTTAWWVEWHQASDERKQQVWDDLIAAAQESIDFQALQQTMAVDLFEKRIAQNIELGAADRGTAIRWIADATLDYLSGYDARFRADGLCYEFNLPSAMAEELSIHLT